MDLKKLNLLFKMTTVKWLSLTLPFALMAAVLAADGMPAPEKLFWILLALFNVRNGGMFVNRLVDRNIDSQNPRTRRRLMPRALLSPRQVLLAALFSFAVYIWASYMLNPLCFRLSPLPIALIVIYPYAKRFTWGLHFILGAVMAFAPMGAWIAVNGRLETPAVVLGLAVLCWGGAFDIILDNQDSEFYRRAGLYSIPSRLGYKRSNQLALGLHLLALFLFYSVGWLHRVGPLYKFGLLAVVVLLAYEYWVIFLKGLEEYKKIAYAMNTALCSLFFLFTVGDVCLRHMCS